MPRFLQPTMSSGELSPGLRARVDLVRYATSLATCRNMITKVTGGAVKRPGLIFRGEVKDSAKATRLIPFVYSSEVKYLVEMGDGYFRFWVGGSLLRDGANAIVEVTTPYTGSLIYDVRFTQSADVLFLVHPDIPIKELRRTAPDAFELADFGFRRGPFRAFNSDEAKIMAVSGVTGNVTVTTNVDTFTPEMVGSLLYVEEKELRSVKPWTPLEKNVPNGTLRRSDGKVYKATDHASGGSAGTPYYICGNTRPTHDQGRAWDGPADVRSDGVNDYAVGVEWAFLRNTFGILKITEYTSATSVQAVVIERVPETVVGTAPAPVGGPWTFDGDGTTKVFSVTGASSDNEYDYKVTIDGEPVQSNPYYNGGGGVNTGGGGNPRPGGGSTPTQREQ